MSNKLIYILIGVVFMGLTGWMLWRSKQSDAKYTVSAKEVVIGEITEVVSATGRIQPEKQVKISPEVPGEIIELPIVEGQKILKGELLAKLNPDVYQASVSRAIAGLNGAKANEANSKARLEQAKARFINAKRNFERQEKLNTEGVISDADFDAIKSEYEVAQAEVNAANESLRSAQYNIKSAQATVKEANDNLKRTTIYAPIDGTVSMLNVENGERVVGTAQMAGTEMLRVADLTQMEVNVEVNESDIVRVKVGDKATVEVDAYLNRKFDGVVTEISNSSANNNMGNSNEITVFNVKVRVSRDSYTDLIDPKNPHLSPFRPGMSANVDITTKALNQIVLVPIQSVTMRPEPKKGDASKFKVDLGEYDTDELFEVVFVVENDTAKMVKVTTGIQDTKNIQIVAGLSEGQKVITGPYSIVSNKLMHGQTVDVKSKTALYADED